MLLLWTVADVTSMRLCALDNEGGPVRSAAAPERLRAADSPSRPSSSSQHVDDCFCYSHCVELHVRLLPPASTGNTANL